MGRQSNTDFTWRATKLMSYLGSKVFKATLAAMVMTSTVMAPNAVTAREITVEMRNCTEGIHLTASDARLSEVLERLSEVLGFRLQFDSNSDPVVNINITRQPVELVQALRSEGSKIISQTPDSHCPGRNRITAVWVLPEGNVDASLPDLSEQQSKQLSPQQKKARAWYFRSHGGMLPEE